jgi:cytosine/adenosine deaminase-related metal-dependent hydrolase
MKESAGFVDAHSHLRSTSLEEHLVGGSCLEEAIIRMNAMTSIDVEDDVFVASCNLVASGVTGVQFIFHTFGTPNEYLKTLEKSLSGIRRSGIRAQVILAITDQFEFIPQRVSKPLNLPPFVATGRKMSPTEFREVFEDSQIRNPDFVFGVGPVAPQWCSDEMLRAISEIARQGIRVHTHCLESESQRNWISQSPIERLDAFDLLGPHTSLAHAIWLTDAELKRVHKSGTHLVTCPKSNIVLKSGRADCTAWRVHKINFGIGLDSVSGIEEPLRTAKLALTERDALHALTIGGSEAAGLDTSQDIVQWSDWESSVAQEVSIAGKVIFKDGAHLRNDELVEARARVSREMAEDSQERSNRHASLDKVMKDYLEAVR